MSVDVSRIFLETRALTLACSRVPMDEETFGVPIAALERVEVRDAGDAALDYRAFADWCASIRLQLCSARLAQSRIDDSMFLEERGFRFIELAYLAYLPDLSGVDVPKVTVDILPAAADDRESLTGLAERTFQIGRFHQDPRVETAAANRRYGRWMWRAFENERQQVLKCVSGGEVIGFFVVEAPSATERFWSLIGLAPEYTGRGLGYQTWIATMRYHQTEGVKRIATRISSHNIAIVNLYVKLGFRFAEPEITLHWRPSGSESLGS
jgi:RimJ/RimL family protein N-acetyltransferase